MKNNLKYSLCALLLIISTGTLLAQTPDRIDREIRIAEGILAELFDAKQPGFTLSGANVRGVTGEYIPGYGVHFKIGANIHPQTLRVVIRGHAQIERDEEQDPAPSTEENRAFIEDRFMEYFKNYASLLRGIPEDEVIRITFGDNRSVHTVLSFPPRPNRQRNAVPEMTAWASVSDIKAYSDRNLSDEEFENQIQIKDISEAETERDQEVFASILETALNQAGTEKLRVRRSPKAEYLPGLGLNYHVNVSLGSWPFRGDFNLDGIEIHWDSLAIGLSELGENLGEHLLPMAEKLDSIFVSPHSFFNPHHRDASRDSLVRAYRDSVRAQRDNQPRSVRGLRRDGVESQFSEEEILEEIDKLHAELKQTVMEYGPTLRSLPNDEMLIITLHWSGRHSALPQRSELRIRKADLLDGAEPEIQVIDRK